MEIRNRIKELRQVKASELSRNPRNWRRHPVSQTKALQGALAEIGYADALIAYETEEGLMLIDGHLRAETTPDMEVPVLITDLDELEANKLLATLDPLAAMAQTDLDAFLSLIANVETDNDALKGVVEAIAGGNLKALEAMQKPKVGLTDPDEVPPEPEEPWVQVGDLFQLGEHRLLCGDATVRDDVGVVLGDGIRPTIMVTDPPYGVNYEGGANNEAKRDSIIGDDSTDLYGAALSLSPADVAYLWHSDTKAEGVYKAVADCKYEIRAQIIWVKLNPHFGAFTAHYMQAHEPLLYCVKGKSHWVGPTNERTVWEIVQPHRNEYHPTQKPVECMERPIRNHEGNVYDPFLGSGTTLIACEKLDRICYAMEIEPKYAQIAIERWQNYTGQKAVHLNNSIKELESDGNQG